MKGGDYMSDYRKTQMELAVEYSSKMIKNKTYDGDSQIKILKEVYKTIIELERNPFDD